MSPISGPIFSPNAQFTGRYLHFVSVENEGTVKTWGVLAGYTPTNPAPGGGSYTPTTPPGLCSAVPNASFPVCGPQRRPYFQYLSATYEAVRHGVLSSPAEIGTYGQLTTIDASQAPYYGTVTFSGAYHLRGDVKFVNGTFNVLNGSAFYVDHENGLPGNLQSNPNGNQTSVEVQNATLNVNPSSTWQAACPGEQWGGIVLSGQAKMYTFAPPSKFSYRRSTIRDARTGVYSLSPGWPAANTNEYYLIATDFLHNGTGLFDQVKGTAQPGEGVRYCSFRDSDYGIILDIIDDYPGVYADYGQALFSNNTFDNLRIGIYGISPNNIRIVSNTFTNCYTTAISVGQDGPADISGNTITVPAQWPAALLAQYPAGHVPESIGIEVFGNSDLAQNLVQGATANPTTNQVWQIGVRNYGNGSLNSAGVARGISRILAGNTFASLDQGVIGFTNYYYGSSHVVTNSTFRDNREAITLYPIYNATFQAARNQGYIRCNTFENPGNISGATGLWIKNYAGFWEPGTGLSELGSSGTPNGNRFAGIDPDQRVVNDNSNNWLTYYRYGNSLHEQLGIIKSNITLQATGTVNGSTTSPNLSTVCGGSGNPGASQRASAVAGFALPVLQAKLDSLQDRSLTPRQQQALLAQIASSCEASQNLPLLESSMQTLAGTEPALYQAGALYLLNAYRNARQEPAAQRVLADLKRRNTSQDVELTNYLRYMEATGHLGSVLPRPGHELAEADRALLRQVAASGTSIARLACPLLRFYEPRCACRLQDENPATALAAGNAKRVTATALGEAYPNPARTNLRFPYALPSGTQKAELVTYDALGRRVAALPLAVAASGEALVDVQTWAAGLYHVALVADGQVLGSQRVAVAHD